MARSRARDLPECTAILLCERFIFNANTQRNTVVDTMSVWEYPFTVGPLEVYARLMGGVGSYAFRFEIHDLAASEIATATAEDVIEFRNAEEVVTLRAELPTFDVLRPGPLDLVLYADNRDIGHFTFHIVSYESEGEDDATQEAGGPR